MDLDALLVKSNIDQTLEQVKKQAEYDLEDGVWFRFETQVDLATQGEYGGIRHVYRAGIGEVLKNIKKAQIINFDLGIGDPITPGPQKVEVNTLIGQESMSWSKWRNQKVPGDNQLHQKNANLVVPGDIGIRRIHL